MAVFSFDPTGILRPSDDKTAFFMPCAGVSRELFSQEQMLLRLCRGAEKMVLVEDLTVLSDASELKRRLQTDQFPWFVHPCPKWKEQAIAAHPELIGCFSVEPEALPLVDVAVVPCVHRKRELTADPRFQRVITERELQHMLCHGDNGFKLPCKEHSRFDLIIDAFLHMEGQSKPIQSIFSNQRQLTGIVSTTVTLGGRTLSAARAMGCAAAQDMLLSVKEQRCPFDIIEVTSCTGNCH